MAVICSFCGTENRAVAKFCIECIGPLTPDFEPTQVLSRDALAAGTAPGSTQKAFADFAAAPPPAAPLPPAIARRAVGTEPRKGLWLSVAAFAITLAIAAGGWMIAGAGGWYIYSAAKVLPDPAPEGLVTSARPDAGPAAPLVPVADAAVPGSEEIIESSRPSEPSALSSPSPSTASSRLPGAAAPQSPSPLQTPATQAMPAAPVAQSLAPSPPPPARTAPSARPRPAAPVPRDGGGTANPLAQCAELGFLARSRCMVAQCAKAEHRAKAVCEPVLAQQRLMEEKRNPSMAN